MNLMCIYSVGSSRASLMQKLMEMKKYLENDEVQLLSLTESTAYLIRKKKNSLIKVVTGVRRCGKSYLLFHLFHNHLLKTGVPENTVLKWLWMTAETRSCVIPMRCFSSLMKALKIRKIIISFWTRLRLFAYASSSMRFRSFSSCAHSSS